MRSSFLWQVNVETKVGRLWVARVPHDTNTTDFLLVGQSDAAKWRGPLSIHERFHWSLHSTDGMSCDVQRQRKPLLYSKRRSKNRCMIQSCEKARLHQLAKCGSNLVCAARTQVGPSLRRRWSGADSGFSHWTKASPFNLEFLCSILKALRPEGRHWTTDKMTAAFAKGNELTRDSVFAMLRFCPKSTDSVEFLNGVFPVLLSVFAGGSYQKTWHEHTRWSSQNCSRLLYGVSSVQGLLFAVEINSTELYLVACDSRQNLCLWPQKDVVSFRWKDLRGGLQKKPLHKTN